MTGRHRHVYSQSGDSTASTLANLTEIVTRLSPPPSKQKWTFESYLDRDDYLNAKWWDASDWHGVKNDRKRANTTSVEAATSTYDFITDEDGNPISATELAALRAAANKLCKGMYLDPIRPPPTTWARGSSPEIANEFVGAMESQFFCLRLCSHHWKAMAVGTQMYYGPKTQKGKSLKRRLALTDGLDRTEDSRASSPSVDIHPGAKPVTQRNAVKRRRTTRLPAAVTAANPLCVLPFTDAYFLALTRSLQI